MSTHCGGDIADVSQMLTRAARNNVSALFLPRKDTMLPPQCVLVLPGLSAPFISCSVCCCCFCLFLFLQKSTSWSWSRSESCSSILLSMWRYWHCTYIITYWCAWSRTTYTSSHVDLIAGQLYKSVSKYTINSWHIVAHHSYISEHHQTQMRIYQSIRSSYYPFHSQEWSISNFPCSLTRKISLFRWKMITLPILTTSLILTMQEGWENVIFSHQKRALSVARYTFRLGNQCWFIRIDIGKQIKIIVWCIGIARAAFRLPKSSWLFHSPAGYCT